MKKLLKKLLPTLFLFATILSPLSAKAIENESPGGMSYNKSVCEIRMAGRRLWIDHVTWTRSFIVSDVANLEDKKDVLHRLLRNQDDIGNYFKPYYGDEAGNKIAKLLREHILLAGAVVDSAKAGDKEGLDKNNKLWYKNADDIAAALSSLNPNYSEKTLKDMLHKHLQFVTDQAVARLGKNWSGDIAAYDKGEDHMVMFADVLSDGLIKQFPDKFK